MTAPTPRCDHLARELARPTSGPFMGAGNDSHKIIDWIALAQALERELAAARISISDSTSIRDALDHVVRVARAGTTPTRRLDWIVKRGQRALDGLPPDSDDRPPENSVLKLKERASELRDEVEDLEADLRAERAYALELRAELTNIAIAKRYNPKFFSDDTEFADWAQSRARYTLAKNPNPSGVGNTGAGPDTPVTEHIREEP